MLNQTTARAVTSRHNPRSAPQVVNQSQLSALELMGVPMTFPRGAEVYGEGEPSEYIYRVISGSVRTYKILDDGRRQIGAFHLPGDFLGLEAGEAHRFSAEAVAASTVLVIKRSALLARASRDGDVARNLWNFTARELDRVGTHSLLLIQSAQERVASFLLEMAERLPGSDTIELPMSRQDIADYLGLTIETVSRVLTKLETQATIALPSARRIQLRNRTALQRLNA